MSDSENGAIVSEVAQAPVPDVRDLARKAAEEAMNPTEGGGAEEGAKESAEEEAKAGNGKSSPGGKDPLKVAVVMRAREQARRIMEEARGKADEVARKERELAQLQSSIESERKTIELFKKDPIKAIEIAGKDPAWFTEQVLLHGRPDPVKEQLSPVEEKLSVTQDRLEKLEQMLQQRMQADEKAQADKAAEAFTQMVIRDDEKYPYLSAIYSDDSGELIQKANNIAQLVYDRTESYPSFEDIAEYLEDLEQKRYSRLQGRQKTDGNGKAPQDARAKEKGVRTLGGAAVSQKASNQIPFEKMNEMQQREYLKQQAELAMRSFK